MATEIKICFADGNDRNAVVDISAEQAKLVREFLGAVNYGDVHRRIADFGDGNALGSPSDIKTREC